MKEKLYTSELRWRCEHCNTEHNTTFGVYIPDCVQSTDLKCPHCTYIMTTDVIFFKGFVDYYVRGMRDTVKGE